MIRWALLFWTRANPTAYDELANVLHLPSRRTLRGYRNHLSTGGFDVEALGRIAAKQRIDNVRAMAHLLEAHEQEQEELRQVKRTSLSEDDVQTGTPLETVGAMEQRHLHERFTLAAQLEWGWNGCICFDSAALRQALLHNSKTKEVPCTPTHAHTRTFPFPHLVF